MNKIPTVEEFFNQYGGYTREEMLERAKKFASVHVAATIKTIQASSVDGMEWIEEFATI